MVIALCDIIEYSTSFLMEKLFHVRWWDYSKTTKFNLNGRIALETSVLFGLGGLMVIYLIQPVVAGLVGGLSPMMTISLAVVSLVILLADTLFSTLAATAIKKEVVSGAKISSVPEIKKFNRDYYRKHNRMERKTTRKAKRVAKRGW